MSALATLVWDTLSLLLGLAILGAILALARAYIEYRIKLWRKPKLQRPATRPVTRSF